MDKVIIPPITILTPTYNRAQLLPRLYKSLQNQSNKNFQWLIIDDGSKDKTEEYLQSIHEDKFLVEYRRKENGGKHTALNYAVPYIKGDFVCIVDSDDCLTEDAVQTILDDWKKYKANCKVGIISYQRSNFKQTKLRSKEADVPDYFISDEFHFRLNRRLGGDRAETFRAEFLKRYPFPVFAGEKFMAEGWFWHKIAEQYLTVYRKKVIYLCDYLDGGLTKSGRSLRMRNPLGAMENCKSCFCSQVSVVVQIKQMLLYGAYGFCSIKSPLTILNESKRPKRILCILPFSYCLYLYWCYKYNF